MRVFTPVAAIVVSALSLALPLGDALAQVKEVEPYAVVVTADKAALRCGDTEFHYKVAELPSGTVLRVDAEGPNWSRVSYPANGFAFIKADEATADQATQTLTTSKPSQLKAAYLASGFASSWKPLLATPLAAGTSLKILETIKEGDQIVGFKVAAPDAARGFISNRLVRRATPEEAKSVGVIASDAPKTEPTTKSEPGSEPTLVPVTPTPDPATKLDLRDPQIPTEQPATTVPTVLDPAASNGTATPTEVAGVRPVAKVDDLEALFDSVRRQPAMEAEYDELVAEIDRAIADTPDTAMYRSRRLGLKQRRDYLELQIRTRDAMRNIEAAKRQADENARRVSTKIAELEAQRVYTIIGQLVPSTVYDGQRLPLMYRLQSVGAVAPRTLGYIKPDNAFSMGSKLGMVVGVIGDATMDKTLRLNIITPIRVDVLQAVPTAPIVVPGNSNAAPTGN